MRLQQATLESELLKKAELEELYLRGFENEIKQYQREAITERKMKEELQKETAELQKETAELRKERADLRRETAKLINEAAELERQLGMLRRD